MKQKLTIILMLVTALFAEAQPDRWQQRVKYEMDIDFNVTNHQFTGKQKLTYTNNSPDTLHKVFYHLYLNAFQPGSLMDVRSRTIVDPDARVTDRISKLKPDEIGYQKIKTLTQNGKQLKHHVEGTILEVELAEPILPHTKHVFDMQFEAQVPLQIRRTGRMSKEGVDYSMTQWYPKMSEYDYEGWHANPYVGREFYGVWGDYDVKITMDAAYTIAGTGYLQNPDKIGHGYSKKKVTHKPGSKLTWHFIAPDVHDFAWAADPDYKHDIVKFDDNLDLHFFYLDDSTSTPNWKKLPGYTVECFKLMNQMVGRYPYKQYSVIQGGDGGMEYPMATLITGGRNLGGLVSVTVHEAVHSWFQLLLGTNESKYGWMDEGFTNYAQGEIMARIMNSGQVTPFPHASIYNSYRSLVKGGTEEPLTTHADHFNTNKSYGTGSYGKGTVFIHQLSYIIGDEVFDKGLKGYFNTWKFKHPNPNDFKRIMEKASGIELNWYLENWIGTTKTIDYAIRSVEAVDGKSQVSISRIGDIPMPLDIVVTYQDGSEETFYIPLDLMRGEKQFPKGVKVTTLSDWGWTYPEYQFTINKAPAAIKSIVIDPSQRLADLNPEDNKFPRDTKKVTVPIQTGNVVR